MSVLDGVVDLSPYALTSVVRAEAYVQRDATVASAINASTAATPGDWLPVLINHATGRIERYCGRWLAARTYRTPVTISCGVTNNSAAITGAGFLAALKTLDNALAAKLAVGSRIKSIESDAALTLDRKATGTTGTQVVSFGSAPLTLSGDDTNTIRIPEGPLLNVYSASWLDLNGTTNAIDIAAARIRNSTPGESAVILTSGDYFRRGSENIQLECKAGILEPSTTELGDWESWYALESACLRLVQMMWQDYSQAVGRGGELDLVNMVKRATSFKLPDDVRETLAPFRRIG